MIFDHIVKFNGKYYAAGEEVPDDEGIRIPFSDMDNTNEDFHTTYTYEELSLMTVKEIKKLAEDKGVLITKVIKDEVINEFLSQQV